jgi:hypothetical protein
MEYIRLYIISKSTSLYNDLLIVLVNMFEDDDKYRYDS